jgi:hypothetical protein
MQMLSKKSVISLISYDAQYLPSSIQRYYPYVDEIVLGLDKDRISWSGNSFSFDEAALWKSLKAIDIDNKISIVEENFHKSAIAIENDNYERNYLKSLCSHDVIFSFDADEVLLNAKEFFNRFFPLTKDYINKKDICMTWVTPYKKIEDYTLIIANEDGSPFFGENQGIATHKSSTFVYARWTDISGAGQNRLMSPLVALHWSLCRDKKDLHQKIHNIGHSDIVDKDPFYSLWEQVTLDNFEQLKNFKTSGLGGAQWPSLVAVSSDKVEEYIMQHINKAY